MYGKEIGRIYKLILRNFGKILFKMSLSWAVLLKKIYIWRTVVIKLIDNQKGATFTIQLFLYSVNIRNE